MQTINLVVLLLTVSSYALANRDDAWNRWKKLHNKSYNGLGEDAGRVKWERNLDVVEEHNRRYDHGLESYSMGLNQFSDLSYEEFKKAYLSDMNSHQQKASHSALNSVPVTASGSAPDSIDWRTKGAVTRVKNQGDCGSCWAFSTVGTLEGQYYLKNSKHAEFSEQQLVDCSSEFGNSGCDGGLMENAYEYVQQFGIESGSAYSYSARVSKCQHDASKTVVKVAGKRLVHSGSEEDLKALVGVYGPAAVAIDVEANFQHYKSGIFQAKGCSASRLNHAVLAVGYGSEGGHDFWIVKNSWGSGWGESGYIRIARNVNGACGIANMASVPEISD